MGLRMTLNLQRLRYFHAVALNGSITAASKALNIAQPALSYHIAAVERELDTTVFERNSKGVKLTPAGAILLGRTQAILDQLDETENEIRETTRLPHGKVTVALAVTMARQIVPPMLRIVDAEYPNVQVKIMDVPSYPAMELMRSGTTDLALVANAADMENCEAIPVYAENFCYIEKSNGKRPGRRPISFGKLAGKPLVMSARSYDMRRRVEEAAIKTATPLDVRYEQESVEITRAIVLAGLAGTITQAALFDPVMERPQLDIRPIIDPEIGRVHTIVRRRDRVPTLAISAVSDALRRSIVELVDQRVFPGTLIASAG